VERVKRAAAIASCWVVLVGAASAETVPIYKPSSPNLEVIVTKRGHPATGVHVTLHVDSRPGDEPFWSAFTDASGRVFPPKLPPGNYRLPATGGKRDATFYINVATGKPERATTLLMKLLLPRIGEAEDVPVTTHVKDFHGIVLNLSGSALPQTHIEVLRKDDLDGDPILQLRADENGEFSGHLNSGTYVALFHCQGFKTYVAVFEVTDKGEAELRITLEVGSVA
jgi:hypothetical protein